MDLLQVRDFGKSGLNTDLPPWDLPPSFLTHAENYRVFSNKIFGFGGQFGLMDFPAGFDPYHVLYSPTPTDSFWIFAGNEIHVFDGNTFSRLDASLPSYDTSNNGWTSCRLGRVPVLNNSGYHPIYWIPQEETQDMQVLPYDANGTWQDQQWSCKAMRSFGPYLIAMNMKEGVDEYPDTLRWSHPAERNEVPISWNESDPATLAGINTLGGDGGDIIDGLALRNSFIVYRDDGITVLEYSNDSYVFNARNLTTEVHIANINCIAEVKGTHFVIASNDILQVTGDKVQSILHDRARVRYSAVLNQNALDACFAVHNTTTKEFWACIPTGDSLVANQAWLYNYRDNTWTIHDINDITHADYGRLEQASRLWNNWNETWATATGNWARQNNSAFNNTIMGPHVTPDPSSLQLLDGFTSETEFLTVLERTDYNLTTLQDVNTITRVYPHMKGTKPVKITVGSQDHAGGPVRWKPSASFLPGVDRKIDVRTTGELFTFKIEVEHNSNFEFSGLDIEYVQDGVR